MFGIGGIGRGGFMRGGLRNMVLSGLGIMAYRWWKNRQAARRNDPGPIGRDPRQSYDTGQPMHDR